jgi:hypothetical protein
MTTKTFILGCATLGLCFGIAVGVLNGFLWSVA